MKIKLLKNSLTFKRSCPAGQTLAEHLPFYPCMYMCLYNLCLLQLFKEQDFSYTFIRTSLKIRRYCVRLNTRLQWTISRPPKLKGTLKRVARNNPNETLTQTKAATMVVHSTVIIGIHLKYQLEDGLFVKYCPKLPNIFIELLHHQDHRCKTMQQKSSYQLNARER